MSKEDKLFKVSMSDQSVVWNTNIFMCTKESLLLLQEALKKENPVKEYEKVFYKLSKTGDLIIIEGKLVKDFSESVEYKDNFELLSYENSEHGEIILENHK